MEHQRELPSAEHPLRQPNRDPTSFSGPFVAPSMSSTPVERKPKAWYMTDSFTEQFSPPGSRFSFAQPSFEIGYPLPAIPPQQQQREAWSVPHAKATREGVPISSGFTTAAKEEYLPVTFAKSPREEVAAIRSATATTTAAERYFASSDTSNG